MQVELIAWTPHPEQTVAAAARLCYSAASASEIARAMSPEKTREFITKLVEMGHQSPLEHVSFTLAVDGVSRALSLQPNACETKLVATMNARSLLHFFRARCCRRAQWEIRRLAEMMLVEVRQVAPELFKIAGPPCVTEEI